MNIYVKCQIKNVGQIQNLHELLLNNNFLTFFKSSSLEERRESGEWPT